jgi:nucleotide-binding universal stress UspA family protein
MSWWPDGLRRIGNVFRKENSMTSTLKIMAAVDLSEYSAMTVRYSVWLAMKLGAELLLVSVINQRDLDMVQRAMIGYEAFSFPQYYTEQVSDREKKLRELFETATPGTVHCRYLVRKGVPYRELLAVIEDERPAMMVVGTKGRSNMADVIIGSTAGKMYHRAPIPLVSIPAGYTDVP